MTEILIPAAKIILRAIELLFDSVIDKTVKNFGQTLGLAEQDNPINRAWSIVRDAVNAFFIFILLYIALNIILQISTGEHKRMLTKLIVIALLVNFSAFFTKVVIDASNVLAVSAYNWAKTPSAGPAGSNPSIAERLTNWTGSVANIQGRSVTTQLTPDAPTQEQTPNSQYRAIIYAGIITIILLIITCFVLAAGAIALVSRALAFVFLIIFSPAAFLFIILPKTQEYFGRWSKRLFNEAIFAPAFLFFIGVSVLMVDGLKTKIMSTTSIVSIIFFGLVINGMMIGSLLVAKSLGAAGASGAMGGLKKLGAFAGGAVAGGLVAGGAARLGRAIPGWAGRKIAASEALKKRAMKGGLVGTLAGGALRTGQAMGQSTYDVRATRAGKAAFKSAGVSDFAKPIKGREAREKEKVEAEKKFALTLTPSAVAVKTAEARTQEARTEADRATEQYLDKTNPEIQESNTQIKTKTAELDTAKRAKKPEEEIKNIEEEIKQKQRERQTKMVELKSKFKPEEEIRGLETSRKEAEEDNNFASQRQLDARLAMIQPAHQKLQQAEKNLLSLKSAAGERKEGYAGRLEKTAIFGRRQSRKQWRHEAAKQVRKGKTDFDRLLESIKAELKEGEKETSGPEVKSDVTKV